MCDLPTAASIRAMHPDDLTESIDKLSWFLVSWFGGPFTYHRRWGQPRLRKIHRPFRIGPEDSAAWLMCMRAALEAHVEDTSLVEQIMVELAVVTRHIENAGSPPE
jgi:hemoglobin